MADPIEGPDESPFAPENLRRRAAEQRRAAIDTTPVPEKMSPSGGENVFAKFGNGGEFVEPFSTDLGAATRKGALAVIPTVGGLAGAAAGGALGTALGSFIPGPGNVVGGTLGFLLGLGGMLGGSMAAGEAQNYALKQAPDSFKDALGFSDRQQQLDEEMHPWSSYLGGMAPMALTMSPRTLIQPGKTFGTPWYDRLMADPKTQRLFGGAMMGAFELHNELQQDAPNWARVAISTGFGMAMPRMNPIGETISHLGSAPFARLTAAARTRVENRTIERNQRGIAGPEDYTAMPDVAEGWGSWVAEPPSQIEWQAAPPTIAQGGDFRVIGFGITKSVFEGVHEQSPATRMIAQEAARNELDTIGPKPEPDLHVVAASLEPELIGRWDALTRLRDSLRDWIGERAAPTDLELIHAQDSRAALERRLEEHLASRGGYEAGGEARRLRADLRAARAREADIHDRRQMAGLDPEYREKAAVTAARQHLVDVETQLHGLSGEVEALYRRAADHVGAETVPTTPAGASEIADLIKTKGVQDLLRNPDLTDQQVSDRLEGRLTPEQVRQAREAPHTLSADAAGLSPEERAAAGAPPEAAPSPLVGQTIIQRDSGDVYSVTAVRSAADGSLLVNLDRVGDKTPQRITVRADHLESQLGTPGGAWSLEHPATAAAPAGETTLATAPAPTVAAKPLEEQIAFIERDAESRYLRAFPWQSEAQARAWAKMHTASVVTASERMEGRAGTPEELYLRESPALRNPYTGEVFAPGLEAAPAAGKERVLELFQHESETKGHAEGEAEDAAWRAITPERTADGKIKGAPDWVKDTRGLKKLRNLIMQFVKEGMPGRFWYEDSAKEIMRITRGNLAEAERLMGLVAIYSPQTPVFTNMNFAIKAYEQWKRGERIDVKTGSQDERAQAWLERGEDWGGRKTNSFYLNLMHELVTEHPRAIADLNIPDDVVAAAKRATVDLWVLRALGYTVDAAGGPMSGGASKYGFSERELQRAAGMLNADLAPGERRWLPHQIQAALWSAIKARFEIPSVKEKTWAESLEKGFAKMLPDEDGNLQRTAPEKNGPDRQGHMAIWRKHALKVTPEEAAKQVEIAKGSFGDAISRVAQNVTWEAVPSTKLGEAINGASYEERANFTRHALQLIIDGEGNDILAARLGINLNHSTVGAGAFEGAINPNVITRLVPEKPAGFFDASKALQYARAIQFIFKQDAVPIFRADGQAKFGGDFSVSANGRVLRTFDTQREAQAFADARIAKSRAQLEKDAAKGSAPASDAPRTRQLAAYQELIAKGETPAAALDAVSGKEGTLKGGDMAHGVRIEFAADLDEAAERALLTALQKYLGPQAGFTKTGPREIAVINYRGEGGLPKLNDEAFFDGLGKLHTTDGQRLGIDNVQNFGSEGDYGPTHDWAADPSGQPLSDAAGGSPVLQAWLRDRRAAFEQLTADHASGKLTADAGRPERNRSVRQAQRAAASAAEGAQALVGLPQQPIQIEPRRWYVPGPIGAIRRIAVDYARSIGLIYTPPTDYVPVNPERATRIAQAFEEMKHDPHDPEVKAAYEALAKETIAQWEAIKKSGIKVEWIKAGQKDPYAKNPRAAAMDIADNNHWWGFPTELGHGSGTPEERAAMQRDNPLLRKTGEVIDGHEVVVNDIFRIVHDVLGHAQEGVGFRAGGEENAWRSHSALYTPLARRAMTSETRGQNSWVNYGPHAEANRKANAADTIYSEQKVGLLPDWVVNEGSGQGVELHQARGPEGPRVYDIDGFKFYEQADGTWTDHPDPAKADMTFGSEREMVRAGGEPVSEAALQAFLGRREEVGDIGDYIRRRLSEMSEAAKPGDIDLHQEAWHGGPHIFDRFTLAHIGRGEGHQTYGWGLYFAGAKAVAKYYRDLLTNSPLRAAYAAFAEMPLDNSSRVHAAKAVGRQLEDGLHGDEALRAASREILLDAEQWKDRPNVHQKYTDAADAVMSLQGKDWESAGRGRLYRVDIPEDGAYLHWDKKLSEQSEEVRAGLARLGITGENLTGADIYTKLASRGWWKTFGGADALKKRASLALREEGIPGIKYLDERSRDAGEGTHNYVLFDEDAIKILDYEQRKKKVQTGMLTVREGQRDLLTIFKEANASTGIHELFHHYLEQWRKYGDHEWASPGMKRDWQIILDALGVKHGNEIQREHHERWARWGEQYMRLGVAPSRELVGVFAGFRRWLEGVYKNVQAIYTGSGIPMEHRVEISPQMREVMDRMFARNPERITIAPDKELGPTIHDIHTVDAAHTPPAEAEPTLVRVDAETTNTEVAAPPEVQNAIQAAIEAGAHYDPTEGGAGPGQAGSVQPGAGDGSQPGGRPLGAADAAVVGGGGGAGQEGTAARGEPAAGGGSTGGDTGAGTGERPSAGEGTVANDIAPRARPDFSERPAGDVDLAGNVRVPNLTSVEKIAQAIHDSADRNNGFMGVRGSSTPGQMLDLAEAMGLRPDQINEGVIARLLGGTQNLGARILAARKLVVDSATIVSDLMKKAADGNDKDVAELAVAIARHDMIQSALSGVTAEWGRAGRAFRNLDEGWKGAMDLNQFLMENTGRSLNQVKQIAKMGVTMTTEGGVSKLVRDSGKRGFWASVVEFWINNLISGPVSQITYAVGGTVIAINRIVPETAAAALIGRIRQAMGRQGEVVGMNEIPQMLKAAAQALAPAVHAGGQTYRTGATGLLPGETARPDMVFQPEMRGATPAMLDPSYQWKQMFPDLFGVLRGAVDAVKVQADLLAGGGVEGSAAVGVQRSTLGAIPDITIKGVNVLPLGQIARFPSTNVAAFNSFFRAINYTFEVAGHAARTATNEGLTGEAWNRRVAELRMDPPAEIMIGAEMLDPAALREVALREKMGAEARTEASGLALMGPGGEFTRALSTLTNKRIMGVPMLKFIDPFVTISSNVITKAIVETTPLAFASPEMRADLLGRNGNIAQDRAQARMLMGTVYALAFGTLAAQGLISGSGPKQADENAMWRLAGNQAHSVRIGDTWYDVGQLQPLGLLLSVAADIYDMGHHYMDDGDMQKAAFHLIHGLARNVLETSFMRGPSDLMKALEDPERHGSRWISQFASSFVPYSVGLGQMARASDPYSRKALDVVSAMKAKIPGWSESLLPRRDVWGEEIKSREALGSAYLLSIYETKANADPVNQELFKIGIFPAPVDKMIRNVELTPAQYDDYQRIAGKMTKARLDAMVNSPDWSRMPAYRRHDLVRTVLQQNREIAANAIMAKYPAIPSAATNAQKDRFSQDKAAKPKKIQQEP